MDIGHHGNLHVGSSSGSGLHPHRTGYGNRSRTGAQAGDVHKERSDMVRIVTQDFAQSEPRTGEMFIGDVRGQNLVAEGDAPSQRVTAITFLDGARNQWHRHSTEQVLVVTHGEGIIADASGERTIRPGDVVLIQPGELHWHGAKPGHDLTHLAILLPGSQEVVPEGPERA
jgi:quercetin dioxygenase-like cupin family protein